MKRIATAVTMAGLSLLVSFSATPAWSGPVSCVAEVKPAPIHKAPQGMVLEQFYLACLSHASYLVGDLESKRAVVIDPQRDVQQYIDESKKLGLKITQVVLTHVHADFVAGHQELARRTGAQICLGAKTKATFKFTPLKDGDCINLGNIELKVLETPGHTPEAISLLAFDKKASADKPYAVLTGDCLFIGDVGRPDLMASTGFSSEQLAGMAYDSLHDKLLKLPDDTLIYPAHGAGSLCGRNLSEETVSTIGEQRRTNYALQPMSKEQFVKLITENQPTAPKYFGYDAHMNMTAHADLDQTLARHLHQLSTEQAIRMQNTGAQLLDVREMDKYSSKHVPDSLNIPLSGHFAPWCGALLDHQQPIIIIADVGKEKQAATRLGRIGFDNLAGYVKGGIDAFAPESITASQRLTAAELAQRLKSADAPLVVDIRTDSEREKGFIEGSMHIPLINLPQQIDKLPHDRDVVVHCATGYRSSIGASLLRQQGISRVSDLTGGMTAWQDAHLPVKQISQKPEQTAPSKDPARAQKPSADGQAPEAIAPEKQTSSSQN